MVKIISKQHQMVETSLVTFKWKKTSLVTFKWLRSLLVLIKWHRSLLVMIEWWKHFSHHPLNDKAMGRSF